MDDREEEAREEPTLCVPCRWKAVEAAKRVSSKLDRHQQIRFVGRAGLHNKNRRSTEAIGELNHLLLQSVSEVSAP